MMKMMMVVMFFIILPDLAIGLGTNRAQGAGPGPCPPWPWWGLAGAGGTQDARPGDCSPPRGRQLPWKPIPFFFGHLFCTARLSGGTFPGGG